MSEKNTNVTETVEVDPGMSVMPEGPGPMDVPTVIPELGSMLAAMPSALPAYQTTAWKNKPSTETPIDAAAMTRIERRLVDLTAAVNALRDSVGQPVTVEVGDALINDQGYFSLLTVQAFMTAIGGTARNIIRIDLETYTSVTPVSPFSLFGYWVIGQPKATVKGLKIRVWTKA